VKHLFEKTMAKMVEELEPEEFRLWLAPLDYVSADSKKMTVRVPNIFFKSWIMERYLPGLTKNLAAAAGRELEIDFVCGPQDSSTVKERPRDQETALYIGPEPLQKALESGINNKYTFANFVVGSNNQLAHAASMAVANHSAAYNPLFIYGGSGLGKTHLLNAIGNHLLSQDPNLQVIYRTSEQFTNELIEALRTEKMNFFRHKHRNIDALIIDDIHFIGGKERTQEEFFYTFNALYEADKQIVLSSDKMPKEIPDLEDRLRSRFEGGLFADISPPDRETKVAILGRKAEEEGMELSTDVAFYLASQNETNIRVLEGYLSRLSAYASLMGQSMDLETAQRLLGMFIEADSKLITLENILKTTADYFHLKIADLKSGKKIKTIAGPRQAVMYLARQMTGLSTTEIGQRLGGRDHSTVIHACKKVQRRMSYDRNYAGIITDLEKAVRQAASRPEY